MMRLEGRIYSSMECKYCKIKIEASWAKRMEFVYGVECCALCQERAMQEKVSSQEFKEDNKKKDEKRKSWNNQLNKSYV